MRICCSQIFVSSVKKPFEVLNEVTITSTWKNLCDTATIKLPRRYQSIIDSRIKTTLDKVIKSGDEIEVQLGYDFNFKTRFKGFLKTIKPNYPIELEVEDKMYQWKRTKVKPKAFRGGDVGAILEHIGIIDYKLLGDKITIGDFLITDEMNTIAKVLEKLKEASGLPVFMRKNILYVGGQYDMNPKNRVTHKFIIGESIISHSLEYQKKEDNPIQVEVISKQNNGADIKVIVGEKGDNINKHTLHANPNIKDREALEKIGYAEIDKVSYTGWKGKIKVFGEPLVSHGDIIELEDMDEGIIKGKYFVDGVDTTMSALDGYKQEIELGQIVK